MSSQLRINLCDAIIGYLLVFGLQFPANSSLLWAFNHCASLESRDLIVRRLHALMLVKVDLLHTLLLGLRRLFEKHVDITRDGDSNFRVIIKKSGSTR